MSDALWIRELTVRRMPGFPSGGIGLSRLCGGINLVRGPNASGKTTTARAIQALLWQEADDRISVAGRLEMGGASWLVDVDGRHVQWQREGHPASPPPLPPAETRSRYFLSLHELLQADDRELADLIRIESAGGYDVPSAARELGFGTRGRPHKLVTALGDALDVRKAAMQEAYRLRDAGRELYDLRSEADELHASAERVRALEKGLYLAHVRVAASEAHRRVESFPEALATLLGDEIERLREWKIDEASHLEARTKAMEAARDAERRLGGAQLGEEGIDRSVLQDLAGKTERARDLERDVAAEEEALAEARARRERTDVSLGMEPASGEDSGPPVDLSERGSRRLDAFLRRAGELQASRAALQGRLEALDAASSATGKGESATESVERARAAIGILREWLRSGAVDSAGDPRRDQLLLGSALVLVSTGALTLILGVVSDPTHVAGIATGLFAAAAGIALLVLRPRSPADPRSALQAEAERLGQRPGQWTFESVREHLDGLERTMAKLQLDEERRTERARLERDREKLEQEALVLSDERTRLAGELGIAPPEDDLSLHLMGTRLLARDAAEREAAGAAGRLAAARDRLDGLLEAARELLEPYGHAPRDVDMLVAARNDLQDRRERHEAATRDLADARRREATANEGLRKLRDAMAALWTRTGLEGPDREAELRLLVGQLDAYRAAVSELDGFQRDRDTAGRALRDLADADDTTARSLLEDEDRLNDPASLEHQLENARRADREAREVRDRITEIQTELKQARRRHDLEDAIARVDEARAQLEEQRNSDIEAEVGDALATWLQRQSSDHNRPAVFHRARDLLVQITRGRYRLEMSEGDPAAFRAYDTEAGRGRALDELSAGTRLQLLLAVRIAFVETLESGATLPLLLDEVLANCDDHRARAIMDAAVALAKAGRQTFYFTAQADELAKWREVLEQSDVSWVERGLATPGDGDRHGFEWTARPTDPASLPEPDGRSHAEYGRALEPPRFDPWATDVGGLHLWYLVDEPDTLHGLLAMGISTWGQLETLARSDRGEAPPVVSAAVRAAGHRATLCERFTALYRRGRGRPIDRSVLLESDAVSEAFIDEVSKLCRELEGQGVALMDALADGRVSRFRTRMIEKLETFLVDQGHISREERLSDDRILAELVSEAHRLGSDLDGPDIQALVLRLARGPEGA